jgi:hypothetical protein
MPCTPARRQADAGSQRACLRTFGCTATAALATCEPLPGDGALQATRDTRLTTAHATTAGASAWVSGAAAPGAGAHARGAPPAQQHPARVRARQVRRVQRAGVCTHAGGMLCQRALSPHVRSQRRHRELMRRAPDAAGCVLCVRVSAGSRVRGQQRCVGSSSSRLR